MHAELVSLWLVANFDKSNETAFQDIQYARSFSKDCKNF